MVKSKQELIDDIMDCFDFHRVHKCMVALEWGWHTLGKRVPERNEICKAARKLMQSIPDKHVCEEFGTGTGGLHVRAFYNNEELESMELLFVVSDWSSNVKDKD